MLLMSTKCDIIIAMSTFDGYFAEKLTEYTDEWAATRLQCAVHTLGMEAVLAAKEAIDSEVPTPLTEEEQANILELNELGLPAYTVPLEVEIFHEEIKYFNGVAFRRIDEIGPGYWMVAVEPDRISAVDRPRVHQSSGL